MTGETYQRHEASGAAVVLRSPLLARAGVRHGFGTRLGGVSAGSFSTLNFGLKGGDDPANVRANQARLGVTVGFDPARLFRVRQVHGRRVVVVDAASDPDEVRAEEADALTSAAPGAALGVGTADCVPVLLASPRSGAVGAAHAGWRGLCGGTLEAVAAALSDGRGAAPDELLAAVGPCIGPCCYEVGADVAARFAAIPGAVIERDPRPHLNLVAVARHALLAAGLSAERISAPAGLCTRCQPALFFSYRRDGDATGHHLSVIVAG